MYPAVIAEHRCLNRGFAMSLDWISTADRLKSLPPYVFARLDELKANARAEGVDLIDLGWEIQMVLPQIL